MPRKGLRSYKEPGSSYETNQSVEGQKKDETRAENEEKDEENEPEVTLADDKNGNEESLISDDEAPESMTFSKSKESALQKVKDAMQQIQDSKKQRKEKRRQINEKYTEQKKRRLEALAKARLPDDILAEIPSQPVLQVNAVKSNKITEGNKSDKELISDSSDEEEIVINQEFIPLKYDRYGGVNVTTEKEILTKTKSLSESALEFKNKSLYGGRIPRISTKQKMLKNKKRQGRFI